MVPFDKIHFDYSIATHDYAARMRVFIAPLNEDTPTEIIFTFLNFISWKNLINMQYVKCVVWDLDDTLWDGVFSEMGEKVRIRESAINAISELDKKGIINTIVSKNNYMEVYPFLVGNKIDQLFIHPTINWKQKSENIKDIAQTLCLSVDSFAFIDDSEYEINEVRLNCPGIRVYSANSIPVLQQLPEFNPPVSSFSHIRRETYQAEMERQKCFVENGSKNYYDYIKGLGIECRVTPLLGYSAEYERCFELLSRSNQYNLRTRRYTMQEFALLVSDSSVKCFSVEAKDRYGKYGIICFFSLQFTGQICSILDLVFSCRISRKGVEYEIIRAIHSFAKSKGSTILKARFVETPKNQPLKKILEELPFNKTVYDNHIEYKISTDEAIMNGGYVVVRMCN